MRQNYFIYKGKRYDSGTMIIVDRIDPYAGVSCKTKVEFLYYETDDDTYAIKVNGDVSINKGDLFLWSFHGSCEEYKNRKPYNFHPQKKQWSLTNELNIKGMLAAWTWYVVIMAVAVIFNDRIGIWILASVVFFDYRYKKLKEAGYK